MRKAITPVISIIILLLITISLSGMGWTYMSGYYEAMTSKQIKLVFGSGMGDQVMISNTGTADMDPGELRIIVNGKELPIENTQPIEAGKSANIKFGQGSCREILEGAGESVRVIGPGNSFSYSYPDPDSGVYAISPDGTVFPEVYCDMGTDGGGWTMILQYNTGKSAAGDMWSNYNNMEVRVKASEKDNPGSVCLDGVWELDSSGGIAAKRELGGGSETLPEEVGNVFQPNVEKYFNDAGDTEWIDINEYYSICGASGWESIGSGTQEVYIR